MRNLFWGMCKDEEIYIVLFSVQINRVEFTIAANEAQPP